MGRHVTQNIAIAFLIIGVAQFAFGLCVVITTAVFGSKIDASVVEPYWSGVPLLLLGVVAFMVGVMRASGIVVTYIVLAFFTTVVMFLSALFTGLASRVYNTAVDYMDAFGCFTLNHDCVCYTSSLFTGNSPREVYDGVTCGNLKSVHILLEVLVGLSVVGMVAAFIGLFIGGYTHCRRDVKMERFRDSDENMERKRHTRGTSDGLKTVVVDKQYQKMHSEKSKKPRSHSSKSTHRPRSNVTRPASAEGKIESNEPTNIESSHGRTDKSHSVPVVE